VPGVNDLFIVSQADWPSGESLCTNCTCWHSGSKQTAQETQAPNIAWDRRLTLELLRTEAETLLATTKDEKTHHKERQEHEIKR
jgi:hypothetical protein